MSVFMNAFARLGEKQAVSIVQSGKKAKNVVEKILTSRNTLQSSDLSGETFTSVLNALKNNGVNDVKLVASKNGGFIVHAKNVDRNTGLINLFPGGVMGPNGKLSVSFKFNAMGDCLQMTGLQKYPGVGLGASTIRTNAGIANLQKQGLKNPTEYIQVVTTKNSKGVPYRHVNKTYSPFADKSSSENIITKTEAEAVVQNVTSCSTKSSTIETSADFGRFKMGRVSVEEREIRRQEALGQALFDKLREYNPELAQKVSKRIDEIRRKDLYKAGDFINDLVKRYSNGQNDLARFAKRTDDLFGSNNWSSSFDDVWGQRMQNQVDDFADNTHNWIGDNYNNFGW